MASDYARREFRYEKILNGTKGEISSWTFAIYRAGASNMLLEGGSEYILQT